MPKKKKKTTKKSANKPNKKAILLRVKGNKKKLIKGYVKGFGNVTIACQIAGISRYTFYEYLKNDPEFKEAIDKTDDEIQDKVESLYIRKDLLDQFQARKYWLDRRHKKYKPKSDVEISGGKGLLGLIEDDLNENEQSTS